MRPFEARTIVAAGIKENVGRKVLRDLQELPDKPCGKRGSSERVPRNRIPMRHLVCLDEEGLLLRKTLLAKSGFIGCKAAI